MSSVAADPGGRRQEMERKKARPVSPWPALIAVVIALCAGGPAWSHEGHDDGPAQSLVGDPNLVVRSVVNENYEAVVKYHASRGSGAAHLRIYLSDFATNAPVPNARLNLATTAPARIEATAAPVTPGVYEAD